MSVDLCYTYLLTLYINVFQTMCCKISEVYRGEIRKNDKILNNTSEIRNYYY